MLKTRDSREFWLLFAVALLVLGAGLGLRDPWPADEPRFALVARQMVESGDWLFPRRGIELYSDKPPMLMWLQAATYTLLRDWRIAFLLPSLLAALGTLWCAVDLGGRLWTRRAGVLAGWALLFALQFTYQAKKAQIDPLVTFWITLSMYGFLRHLLTGPDWRMWTLGWAAAGLGTITKGVGFLSLLVLLPAALATWRGWRLQAAGSAVLFGDRRAWWGPLAFVAAVSVWLVPMVWTALASGDPDYQRYMHDILFRQTVSRYADPWGHVQGPLYFLEVIATGWMPTALALLWAVPAWARRVRRRDLRFLLPLAWCVLVVLFFSLSRGKRDVYILPALPMLCLALGPLLAGIVRHRRARRTAFGVVLLMALLLLGAGLAMWFGAPRFETSLLAGRGLRADGRDAAALLLAFGAWGLAVLSWQRVRGGVAALLWTLGGVWVLYGLVAYPLANPSSSSRAVMESAQRRVGADGRLGLVAWKEQNLLMAPPGTADFGFRAEWTLQMRRGLAWQAADPARRWLFVQEPALGHCVDRGRAEMIGAANRRRWWLVPAAAVIPGCVPHHDATTVESDASDDG